MRELKRQFCMRWDEMLLVLGLEAGFFLLGEIMLGIIVHGLGEKESVVPLGTIMALLVPVVLMLFVGMSSLPLYFNMAVGMGSVRRHVVPAMLGMSMLINIVAAWMAYVFYYLEKWIFHVVYSGIVNEIDLQFVFRWKYILPACLAVVAVNAIMGALFLKYGKIAFTIFWILWMVGFIGGPRAWKYLQGAQDHVVYQVLKKIGDLFFGFSERGILTAVAVASAAVIFTAWMLLRKQQVDG